MTEEHRQRMIEAHEREDELHQVLIATHVRDGEAHIYMSTACVHGKHGSCRTTCKFCEAPCCCACHTQRAEKPLAIEEALSPA